MIRWAIQITQGMVRMENRELVPTTCAEYSGVMSCSSVSMVTVVAEGMELTMAAKRIHSAPKPKSFMERQTISGSRISFTAE